MYDKIKPLLGKDTVFYGLLVTLVAISAFGLGRASVPVPGTAASQQPLPLGVREPVTSAVPNLPHANLAATSVPATVPATTSQQLVASKSGSRYHYLWCPGARTIKETNKVFFASATAARAAGYTPAANCPGLE